MPTSLMDMFNPRDPAGEPVGFGDALTSRSNSLIGLGLGLLSPSNPLRGQSSWGQGLEGFQAGAQFDARTAQALAARRQHAADRAQSMAQHARDRAQAQSNFERTFAAGQQSPFSKVAADLGLKPGTPEYVEAAKQYHQPKTDPAWKVISVPDPNDPDNKIPMWANQRTQETRPLQPGTATAPAAAAAVPTSNWTPGATNAPVYGSGGNYSPPATAIAPIAAPTSPDDGIPPAPPGSDRKEWKKEQTKLLVQKRAAAEAAKKAGASIDPVTEDIDRSIAQISKYPGMTTGGFSSLLKKIPIVGSATQAGEVESLINTVKASSSLEKLQQMRAQSPTGASGLGAVTQGEHALLQNAIGSLDQSQDAASVLYNLERIKRIRHEIIHGPGTAPPPRFKPPEYQRGEASTAAAPDGPEARISKGRLRIQGWRSIRPEQLGSGEINAWTLGRLRTAGQACGAVDDYAAAPTEKPFLEKLGNFARNVYENPPPSVAAARDIIKGAPAAATELTWGADPEAAEQAAGTMAQAAGMGLSFKGPGGTNVGVAGRPIAKPGTVPALPLPLVLGPSAGDVAVEAAGRLPGNVTVPKYLATDTTLAPRVATGLSQVPFSGQPIVRSAEELTAGLGRAKGEIAGSAATAETAGERARSGLESFTTTRSQQPVSKAYQAVDELIDPSIRVPLTNTADLVAEMNARRANANIPGTSRAADRLRAIKSPLEDIPPELQAGILKRNPELAASPSMDYAGIKDLRTYLRNKTPQQLITEGIDPTEAKRILGTLTKDLENVVSQSGPEALQAWREANALASRTARERKALTRTIGLQGNASAEQVFNRLLTYAGSKSGADLGRLRLAKQAMGPEAWANVGSAMINRMGMAPDGAFSPDRFVTAFGNMSGAAKQELFSGQQAAALSDLFIVAKHVQDRVTRLSNPSGTARNYIPFAMAGHLLTDPISAVASIVGQRMLAEALSRPAMVRAATAVSRASLSGDPVATQHALALLGQVAAREQLLGGAYQQEK